eukprot:SAG31_NODE_4469_length_3207_cov_40.075933_1_plen_216_part_10
MPFARRATFAIVALLCGVDAVMGATPVPELAAWLEQSAGLKGQKLTSALSICEAELIETVAELREVHDDGKLQHLGFKQILLGRVERALKVVPAEQRRRQLQREAPPSAVVAGGCADATGLQSALESVTARVAGLEVYTHISAAPKNLIAQWAGGAETVPPGWVLCDGQNGTPDLRDKFVLGAGGQYAAGSAGGSATAAVPTTGGVFGFPKCVRAP